MRKTTGPRNVLVRTPAAVKVTEGAQSMISLLTLENAMAAVKASVEDLRRKGAPIKEVIVEREIDPEIANRQVLAVTVWMQGVTPGYASSVWKRLHENIKARKALLGREDQGKLRTLVSVGVDVDGDGI
ncbi:MAG: hypothetical protein HY673_03685 [Chloroflexi bacterium]|nr:hypothetical protein [Chloroflexota bacterium]